MEQTIIEGVIITPLKRIYHPQGDIYYGIKKSDAGFNGFGEAYFSTIKYHEIKAWKRHNQMTLNFIVPVGAIRFVLFQDFDNSTIFSEIILSEENYCRLTIPPKIWVGFQGLQTELNLLLNVADMEHDPNEIDRCEIAQINYKW